ncbi:MAG: hypothetical protein HYT80_07420 [Euryarchaeota archaeon]|nr:hypothetical protein [Euryarchaeota archaeon]
MRATLLVLLVVLPAFAGCLHDLGLDADFGNVVLAVRLLGAPDETWQNKSFRLVLHEPTLKAAKTEPGPQGGGGAVFNLTRPLNFTLEAQLEDAARFSDAKAAWTIYDDDFDLLADTTLPGNERISVALAKPGRLQVQVSLGKGLRFAEETRRLEVVIDQRWIIESAVQPVGASPTASGATMQDRFDLEVPARHASLDATTQFRGAWPGPHGTNVDLALRKGARFVCRAAGGAGRPGPEQANESLRRETIQANERPAIFVGGQPAGCPATLATSYANPFLVPYRLFLNVTYPSFSGDALVER